MAIFFFFGRFAQQAGLRTQCRDTIRAKLLRQSHFFLPIQVCWFLRNVSEGSNILTVRSTLCDMVG
jgi:hypothetical protein